jgi:hypothetical protein
VACSPPPTSIGTRDLLPNSFVVSNGTRELLCSAVSEDERQSWVATLTVLFEALRSGQQVAPPAPDAAPAVEELVDPGSGLAPVFAPQATVVQATVVQANAVQTAVAAAPPTDLVAKLQQLSDLKVLDREGDIHLQKIAVTAFRFLGRNNLL